MNVSDFDYVLPDELIAASDGKERRVQTARRAQRKPPHRTPSLSRHSRYLVPGDCLVLNDSKVTGSPVRTERRERCRNRVSAVQANGRRRVGNADSPGKRMREVTGSCSETRRS